ncbi:Gfo/Idh/MocA family protein [Jiangella sp. DSM 45060]|uniref:Gfo/Idh/MocA family protein n=1 Tax=Jiangella sp. DSM 45060 TaxID=1798224 RepID=UPI00087B968F|nr:Gfo/Idh/MocA family oxidoreductase [Jiangella sp. DSM 45060]SDS50869.1 Predicted dehydrogenase [Jiangella sp. DSM 45060]
MRRIGFIGTENSHTDHFLRFLNSEQRHPGFRAVALAGGSTARNETLRAQGGIEQLVDDAADLVQLVDAAIISTRDGARHREQAEPLLAAGLPVLVDKPFATTVDDAVAMLDAAEKTSAVLVSCSALRFVPQLPDLVDEAGRGALRQLSIVGPGDPDSEYSGLFFYGIHHVEAALEILGNPVVEPGSVAASVTRDGDTTVALLRIAGVAVVLTFVVPDDDHRVPFHATATGVDGVVARELTLDRDYNAPALTRFVTAVETGRTQSGREQLLSPVVVMSAIVEALENRTERP